MTGITEAALLLALCNVSERKTSRMEALQRNVGMPRSTLRGAFPLCALFFPTLFS